MSTFIYLFIACSQIFSSSSQSAICPFLSGHSKDMFSLYFEMSKSVFLSPLSDLVIPNACSFIKILDVSYQFADMLRMIRKCYVP